jgi:hypothetical protein
MRQTPPLPTSMPLLQQHLLQNKTLRKHTHTGTKEKAPNSPNPKPSNTPKRKEKKALCILFFLNSKISKNKTHTGFCKNHLNQNFSTSLLKLFQKKKKKRFRKPYVRNG